MLARMDHRTDDASRAGAKAALRAAMREVWREADLAGLERVVAERVLSLPELVSATTVAAYAALPDEIPTGLLVSSLRARGVRVLLPVLHDDGSLGWRAAGDEPLVGGRLGTRHPADSGDVVPLSSADVVVAPGRAFDAVGRRLGRGGGSYDRALVDARDSSPVVGLAVDGAVVVEVPTEPHDRPVDVIVTPTRLLRCARAGC